MSTDRRRQKQRRNRQGRVSRPNLPADTLRASPARAEGTTVVPETSSRVSPLDTDGSQGSRPVMAAFLLRRQRESLGDFRRIGLVGGIILVLLTVLTVLLG